MNYWRKRLVYDGSDREKIMRANSNRVVTLAFFGVLGFSAPSIAQDTYPSRVVKIVNPYVAGSTTDVLARAIAVGLSSKLGREFIIENKPGAGGMLGPAAMARSAAPDGYTLSQLTVSAFRQPHMQKVDWDPLRDFTYVIGVSGYTFGVVSKSDSPFQTFDDLIAYARSNPGQMSYGSTGTGTSPALLR